MANPFCCCTTARAASENSPELVGVIAGMLHTRPGNCYVCILRGFPSKCCNSHILRMTWEIRKPKLDDDFQVSMRLLVAT